MTTMNDGKTLIIAEIGNNHEGSFNNAVKMVESAAKCGVNAVKFQTIRAEHLVSRSDSARFSRLKSFELSYNEFEKLSKLAKSLGLIFISTPFDLESAAFLNGIVDYFKIASSDNTFYPLIDLVASYNKPIIVSSGLTDISQCKDLISRIRNIRKDAETKSQLSVLHCVSSYPTPPEQANLRSISFMQTQLDCTVGYSDHTLGIDACILAVALGAKIVEKHFTLDKAFSDFRDHQLSADPSEMTCLVKKIRQAELLLGSNDKSVQPCEETSVIALRRSIIAARDLEKGKTIELSDITWVRPGGGMAPGEEKFLIGKKLSRDCPAGEKLSKSFVE
ncbi:MAG: N-acetylneuraminate synthase family protein [Candidatus Riflebacteria bacterium]|nr:N-acetylneuraminate synthase family protein [Candidatus Riflebacteria bacterium]